jgi:dihydroorotate dehydrogenase
MYQSIIKPFFFLFSPEKAHDLLVIILKNPFFQFFLKLFYQFQHEDLQTEVAGLHFKNPLGLAAGFDKEAELIDGLASIGFGFIEIGTITPKGQPGNPQPRLFRIPQDKALVNRMGFNNKGLESAIHHLQKRKSKDVLIGGNIGKNKVTPLEKAVDDYTSSFEALYPWVDYFVVNVSSPNTPNLRQLQDRGPLTKIMKALQELNQQKNAPKPVFLKIAPDLTEGQLDDIIEIVQETQAAGIVATNTSISRDKLSLAKDKIEKIGAGGLSGKPLTDRATEIIRYIHQKSNGSFPIIGVGGIHSPEDALEKLEAGASLLQIYTGLIYEGPGLIRKINKALLANRYEQFSPDRRAQASQN